MSNMFTPHPDDVRAVRCKDCKHYSPLASGKGLCRETMAGAEEEGFCSWAKRRDENA